MVWRRKKEVEIEELRRFVDGMKRGQTVATDDSLLETLRQIHDRGDVPAADHDHRRVLLDRLQRRMSEQRGEAVFQRSPVPILGLARPRRSRFQMAVAASILVHVGIGGFLLSWMTFGSEPWQIEEPVAHVVEIELPATMIKLPSRTPDGVSRNGLTAGGAGVRDARPVETSAASVPGTPVALPGSVAPSDGAVPGGVAEGAMPDFVASATGPGSVGRVPVVDAPAAPAGDPSMSEVLGVSYVADPDVAVRVLNSPRPVYTQAALDRGIHGYVRLSIGVGPDGSVREVKVLRSLGFGLDEAAIAAARQCRFAPAMKNGRAVAAFTKVDVSFDLR